MTIESWQRRTQWPMTVFAVLYLVSYSWQILQPDVSGDPLLALNVVEWGTWSFFVLDYLVRVALARGGRLRYVVRHVADLLILTLPMLRPLRLIRFVTLLRLLDRHATRSFQGRVAQYVAFSTVLVLYAGALAELDAERGAPGANINDFGTALWWSITTITTVGYGDHYPVTTTGRVVAAGMMVAGVALLGVVTATLATWFTARVRSEGVGPQRPELESLRRELEGVRLALRDREHDHQRDHPADHPGDHPSGPEDGATRD